METKKCGKVTVALLISRTPFKEGEKSVSLLQMALHVVHFGGTLAASQILGMYLL
jgi:hypothetical protein